MSSGRYRAIQCAALSFSACLVFSALPLPGGGSTGPDGVARAQTAPIVLENLSYPGSVYSLTIPRLEIAGSSLNRDELQKLFDGTSAEPLSVRLARLSLTSASASEVIVQSKFGVNSSRTVYKDVKVSNVVFGNVGELVSSGATLESKSDVVKAGVSEEAQITGKFGAVTVNELDLVAIATVLGETAAADNLPMMTLYKTYRIDGMSMGGSLPDGTLAMSFGRMEGANFRARPSRIGYLKALEIIQKHPNFEDVDDEDRAILLGALTQFFENFDYGVFSLRDLDVTMSIRAPATDGQPGASSGFGYRIGGIDMNVPEKTFSFANISFEALKEGVSFRIGSYSLTGFSLAPTLATLKTMIGNGTLADEDFRAADPRDFVPVLGTFLMKDVKIDNRTAGQSVGIGEYRIAFADQLKGIPTSIGFAMNHVTLDLSGDIKDDTLKEIREAGINTIDFSTSFAVKWRDDQKTIDFSSLHLDEANMGSIDFSGTIGNAQQELFTTSLSTAQILALALTAKNALIEVKNTGGVELIAKVVAKAEKSSPAEVKRNFVKGIRLGLKQTFGNAPAVDQVAMAVETFVLGGTALTIKAKAKNDLGLGFMDFVAAKKPEEILKKIDIEASAR